MPIASTVASAALLSALLAHAATPPQDARAARLRKQAVHALEKKSDHRALALLEQAWRIEPGNADTRDLYAKAALRVGVSLLDQKEPKRARDLFRQGLAVHPRSAQLHLGAGQAARELREDDQAEISLTRAVQLEPELVAALVALGSLKYDKRDFATAKSLLTRAIGLEPQNRLARTILQRAHDDGKVEVGFATHASAHFVLSYHGERRGLERFQPQILAYLETCFTNMQRILRRAPKKKIKVLLYTRTEFKTLNRNADWIQAYYDGKVRIPLDSWPTSKQRVQATIRHELTHACVQELYGPMSAWLHEGFAQAMEDFAESIAKKEFAKAALLPARTLRRPFVLERNPIKARRLYAQSFLLFLEIRRRLGSRGIAPLFERIASGDGSLAAREDQALVSLLGHDLDGMIRELAARYRIAPPTKQRATPKPGR